MSPPKPLGAQDQIRAVRDLIPGSTVTLALGPEGDGVLPWIASIVWRMGPHSYHACTMAATMPEALAALGERIKTDPPIKRPPTPDDF
jgi:hypothetical protein